MLNHTLGPDFINRNNIAYSIHTHGKGSTVCHQSMHRAHTNSYLIIFYIYDLLGAFHVLSGENGGGNVKVINVIYYLLHIFLKGLSRNILESEWKLFGK